MVVGRDNLQILMTAKTVNRMNLLMTYFTLLAGTGADHRQTRWSAKACEEKLGVGRPRATQSILELIDAGLVEIAPDATPARPKYLMKPPSNAANEIFLPMQIVTGFEGGEPLLRLLRESNNLLLVNILIQLYADTQLDVAFATPLTSIRTTQKDETTKAEKVFERGVNVIWRLAESEVWRVDQEWMHKCYAKQKLTKDDVKAFYEALNQLLKLGAIKIDPWIYAGQSADAEPLIPFANDEADRLVDLSWSIHDAVDALLGEQQYIRDRYVDDFLLALPAHAAAPSIVGTVKPSIEADTPGRRRMYARKLETTKHFAEVMRSAAANFRAGNYGKAIQLSPIGGRERNG
jgi:hypothetical protein